MERFKLKVKGEHNSPPTFYQSTIKLIKIIKVLLLLLTSEHHQIRCQLR